MKDTMQIVGTVISGDGYGRRLGFPTANLDAGAWGRSKKKPKLGIFAGTALLAGDTQEYLAAIVIGPTDQKGVPRVEAHLLDFDGSLYGRELSLTLIRYLRPFKEFGSEAELKKQIRADVTQVRETDNKISRQPRVR